MSNLPETPSIFVIVLVTLLGGVLSGYHLAVIAVALPSLTKEFSLDTTEEETVTGCLFFGGIFGCFFGGYISDHFGRRKGLLITDIFFVVGTILSAGAKSLSTLVIGRLVTGFAVAFYGVSSVPYLAEMAPSEERGGIVSVIELSVCFGYFVAYFIGYVVTREGGDGNWRVMFGAPCILAIFQGVMMICLPESKVWLQMKHTETVGLCEHENDNYVEFTQSEKGEYVIGSKKEDEDEIHHNVVEEKSRNPKAVHHHNIQSIFSPPPGISSVFYFEAVIIIFYLAVAQQFCGQVNILNFAPDIFAHAMGYNEAEDEPDKSDVFIPSLFLGSIKFIVTAWVVWEVDHGIGRRVLLISGIFTISLGLFLIICAFIGEVDYSDMTKAQEITSVIGVSFVVIGYSTSFGPLTSLLISELFPSIVRGRALGYAELITMTSAYLVSYTYLTGLEKIGPVAPFTLYFIVSLFSLVFVIIAVPDTGGIKPIDENTKCMEHEMSKMWLWSKSFQLPSPAELAEEDENFPVRKSEIT